MTHIERTIEWNRARGNMDTLVNFDLEIAMLQEELDEFKEAGEKLDKVECFDALLDLQFVLIGTLGKMGLDAKMIEEGYEAVLKANESKSSKKDANGKITKPIDFVAPQKKLEEILCKA